MEDLSLLKKNCDIELNKYRKLYAELHNLKDMINGSLNRIAISDSEEEVERLYNNLINRSIKEYKEKGRECHQQFVVYQNLFDEYLKVKCYEDSI